jgi:tetratricopeptide (TPR) repeat protein
MQLQRIGLTALLTILAATPLQFRAEAKVLEPGEGMNSTSIESTFSSPNRTIATRQVEAEQLIEQGHRQSDANQFNAAIQSWQKALTLYREIGDSPDGDSLASRKGEGLALGLIGTAYAQLGDSAKVIEYFEQSLAIVRELGNLPAEALLLRGIGGAYLKLDNYAKAVEFLQQSLAIAKQAGDREEQGKTMHSLGMAYLNLDNFPRAIEYLQPSLALVRERGDRNAEGGILAALALASYEMGDYAKALEYAKLSLPIMQQLGDAKGERAVQAMVDAATQALESARKPSSKL